MSNIFYIPPSIVEEDRFTGSLHYLVEFLPDTGQALSNFFLDSSGHSRSKFVRAIDHPSGTAEDRPDFLLECEDVDIICEHKISSPLGNKQLERYLQLPRKKPYVLALISNGTCAIPDEVLGSAKYIKPLNSDVLHFRWQSPYEIFANHPNKLARDFSEYMRLLGMRPIQCDSWKGLFDSDETALAFGEQWVEARGYFKQLSFCGLQRQGH